jgi:hypothetical protein
MERCNLKKLNDVEGKEQFHVEVSNRYVLWKIWTQRWKLIVPGKRLETGENQMVFPLQSNVNMKKYLMWHKTYLYTGSSEMVYKLRWR